MQKDLEKRSESTENKEVNEWIHFGFRLAVSSALHPLDYSKTLIQVSF